MRKNTVILSALLFTLTVLAQSAFHTVSYLPGTGMSFTTGANGTITAAQSGSSSIGGVTTAGQGVMLVVTNSVTVTNTATETACFGTAFFGGTNTSSTFWTNGRSVRITANGRYWTPLATADVITNLVYIGANPVRLPIGGLAVNQTASPFRFDCRISQTTSTNAHITVEVRYSIALNAATLSSFADADVMIPAQNSPIMVTAKWSTATSGESFVIDPGALIEIKQ